MICSSKEENATRKDEDATRQEDDATRQEDDATSWGIGRQLGMIEPLPNIAATKKWRIREIIGPL